MRRLIVAGALLLASCGGNKAADNTAVAEGSDSGEVSAVNDTTAIDAATGDAANMAADVNYTLDDNAFDEPAGNNSASKKRPPSHEPDEPGMTNNSAG
jgi:hypothetical protein